ncbi:hypothetical protein [uncultured Cohaesibacter sp.]|uniref:hypothetical protein n=1 Tax=uncultured Cohaesibacter sp. TaxID=1002546 RepID=UPI00292F45FA|nr:hypothetical protein [uncultured Cohaesibacter sp.]
MTENNNTASNPVTQAAALAKAPIGSVSDCQRLIGAIEQIMDALDGVLIEETDLLRNGKLNEALDLVEAKNQLSIQYMLLQKAIAANASVFKQLAPQDSEQLARRHQLFQNTLQANLAVVATAREVSSELVSGINEQIQKGAKAQTYGSVGEAPEKVSQKQGISIDTRS